MKSLNQKVADIIEKRQNELTKLCSELVQARSENPPGDVSDVAKVCEDFLKQEGISYQKLEPEEGHVSVIGTVGKGKPSLILCGHMDVVPAGDTTKWTVPPYKGEVKQGKLYGRGATDQKAGVAAQLMATAAAKDFEDELPERITVANVPDEEAQGPAGVIWLVQNKKLTGDACLITEPTGYLDGHYSIVAGERGTCWLNITAFGKPAHGSTPPRGRNAIEMLTSFLPTLKALEAEAVETPQDAKALVKNGEREQRRLALKDGIAPSKLVRTLTHYTVNIGVIAGGTKTNVVPEKCWAEVDIRVPAGGSPDGVEKFVRSLLPEDFEVSVINKTLPSYTPADDSLVKAIQKGAKPVFGYVPPPTYMPATTDAHFFRRMLGIPAMSFGPGCGELAHTYDEFVYVKDIKNAAKVYANVIADFGAKR
ncbi:MAG TPA: ArgE/DapE family deacylase [Candidatus Bathyarchaeia archaeon]|nr:ArgE/DapE family deacylase [Candidatus Bathyarchaeia archaeon]